MPSTSKSQHDLMNAVAHNPDFAKKTGIPKKVADDFADADKKAGKFQKRKDKFYKKPA